MTQKTWTYESRQRITGAISDAEAESLAINEALRQVPTAAAEVESHRKTRTQHVITIRRTESLEDHEARMNAYLAY